MVKLDEFSEFNDFVIVCKMWIFRDVDLFFFLGGGGLGSFLFLEEFWMVICKDWLDFLHPPKSEKGPLEEDVI